MSNANDHERVNINVFVTAAEREAVEWYVRTERRDDHVDVERLCRTAFYEGLRTIVELHHGHLREAARQSPVYAATMREGP